MNSNLILKEKEVEEKNPADNVPIMLTSLVVFMIIISLFYDLYRIIIH